jgi:tetratricopeptide (TPR) repeat protein
MDSPPMNTPQAQPNLAVIGPVRQQVDKGIALLREEKVVEAIQFARSLADAHPGEASVYAFAAEACNMGSDFPAALAWIDKAIGVSADPQHKIKKAWLLSRSRRRDEIPALVEEVAASAPDGRVLWQLGKLCYHHNLLLEAVDYYERALTVAGENPAWRYDLAIVRHFSGDAEGAEQDLEKLLGAGGGSGSVLYLRSTLRKQTAENNHLAELEARLGAGFARDEDEAGVRYAYAKELEDLGQHELSFAALEAAARKKRATFNYDISAVVSSLREIRDVATADALAVVSEGSDEAGAIFIMGMPRTGTTLTERILLQSGKVRNAGELMDFGAQLSRAMQEQRENDPALSPTEAALRIDFAALGRTYMRGARQMAGGSPIFIDKMPANYLYCGMIHKALPKAKIIHLVRDPLDSCYAIFKTQFFKAYEFSYDLDELAQYYIAYHELMRHWHAVAPGAILDVHYEALVTDTETQARRIYDWCGLEWTPAALEPPDKRSIYATASAAQVREPVHTRSVNSSRRHIEKLAPLLEKLVAAGVMPPT